MRWLMFFLMFSPAAHATCVFTNNSTGTLNKLTDTIFTQGISGSVDVTTTETGWKLVLDPLTAFSSAPSGMSFAQNGLISPSIVSGPNAGATFTGDNSTGYEVALTNMGTDHIVFNITIVTSTAAVAGSYSAALEINCAST